MHYWRCFVWGHCVLLKNQSCLYPGHLLLSTRLTTIHCQRTLFSRFCESLQFAMNTEYQLQQPCPTTLLCNHLDSFFVTLPLLRISISNLVFTWLSILAGQPIKRDHLGTPSNLFSVLWLTEMTIFCCQNKEVKWNSEYVWTRKEVSSLLSNWFFIMVFGCN